MIRPALTGATQYSTEPLPLPMRTSAGFLLTGRSGKIRIQTRPARLRWRVIARRAASIWRAVTRALPVAFMPKAPKLSSAPALVRPSLRPLWRLAILGPLRLHHGLQRSAQLRTDEVSLSRRSCAVGSCSMISPLNTQTLTPLVP